jgi:hypothetical protein
MGLRKEVQIHSIPLLQRQMLLRKLLKEAKGARFSHLLEIATCKYPTTPVEFLLTHFQV